MTACSGGHVEVAAYLQLGMLGMERWLFLDQQFPKHCQKTQNTLPLIQRGNEKSRI
jgi:hypothetical protein